ncbi:hypothetical protein [Flavobacterium sp.]|uniref:hypothetical protein n=1 Tax=Flavobacterium sp. TaxID=239 RepID=UPI002634EC88|nr:hypothetical protein [Flavobacterium sp.]
MEQKNSCFLLLLLFFVASCGNKTFDSTEELTEYIQEEDNNYCYKKTIEGVEYILKYRPTDLLVNQELTNKQDQKKIEQLRDKYNKYMYFNLSMSLNNQELLSNVSQDKSKFGQMVNDLAFGMEKKVNLFTKKNDTLAMTDFVYPRMYGMTNSTSIMIVYPRDKKYLKEEYINFTIEDLGFYTGEVKFKIKTQEIVNEPQLRFN